MSHLPWRKLYVEESGSFANLPLITRAIAAELIKLADDDGEICVVPDGRSAAQVIGKRLGAGRRDMNALAKHIPALFNDGYLINQYGRILIQNFRHFQFNENKKLQRNVYGIVTASGRHRDSIWTASGQHRDNNDVEVSEIIEVPIAEESREEETTSTTAPERADGGDFLKSKLLGDPISEGDIVDTFSTVLWQIAGKGFNPPSHSQVATLSQWLSMLRARYERDEKAMADEVMGELVGYSKSVASGRFVVQRNAFSAFFKSAPKGGWRNFAKEAA